MHDGAACFTRDLTLPDLKDLVVVAFLIGAPSLVEVTALLSYLCRRPTHEFLVGCMNDGFFFFDFKGTEGVMDGFELGSFTCTDSTEALSELKDSLANGCFFVTGKLMTESFIGFVDNRAW